MELITSIGRLGICSRVSNSSLQEPTLSTSPTIFKEPQDAVIVRTWDAHLQAFIRLPTESEECAFQEGVLGMDFDQHLGCYPLANYS